MPIPIQKKIAMRMLELREKKGLKQIDVSAAANMTRSQYGHYELGDKNISVENMQRICEALEISVADFFNHELFTKN